MKEHAAVPAVSKAQWLEKLELVLRWKGQRGKPKRSRYHREDETWRPT